MYRKQCPKITLKITDDAAGILSVKLLTSGEPITALGSTGNIVVVILIIIVIFLGTGALLVVGYRRHRYGYYQHINIL